MNVKVTRTKALQVRHHNYYPDTGTNGSAPKPQRTKLAVGLGVLALALAIRLMMPVPLSREGWRATAVSVGANSSADAGIDGKMDTAWEAAVDQTPGQWFQVDMGTPQTFCKLTLDVDQRHAQGYARSFSVLGSNDGIDWNNVIATGKGASPRTTISFGSQSFRFVRVVMAKSDGGSPASQPWAIAELNLYQHLWVNPLAIFSGRLFARAPSADESSAAGPGTRDAGGASDDPSQYNFENGAQGWSSSGRMVRSVASSSAKAYKGRHSLAITIDASGTGEQDITSSSIPVKAGTTILYHVWIPTGCSLSAIMPWMGQSASAGYKWLTNWVPMNNLKAGQWNTLTLKVPDNAALPSTNVGLHFASQGPWKGVLYLDSVAW